MTHANMGMVVEHSSPGSLLLHLSGDFRERSQAPRVEEVRKALEQASDAKSLSFETAGLTGWDSRSVAFVRNCADLCRARDVALMEEGLPEGVRRLLRLARTVP